MVERNGNITGEGCPSLSVWSSDHDERPLSHSSIQCLVDANGLRHDRTCMIYNTLDNANGN